jgi:hypothetical protein
VVVVEERGHEPHRGLVLLARGRGRVAVLEPDADDEQRAVMARVFL